MTSSHHGASRIAVAATAAILFLSACSFNGIKQKTEKVQARGVQVAAGTLAGAALTMLAPVPFGLALGIGLVSSVVTCILEDDPIQVTVEDGGTLNMGAAVARLQNDLREVKRERDEQERLRGSEVAKWFWRCIWIAGVAFGVWFFSRAEWFRKAFIRRQGELHSKFWSFIHALVPGETTRRKAERK